MAFQGQPLAFPGHALLLYRPELAYLAGANLVDDDNLWGVILDSLQQHLHVSRLVPCERYQNGTCKCLLGMGLGMGTFWQPSSIMCLRGRETRGSRGLVV